MNTQTLNMKLCGMICPECEDEAAAALLHTCGVVSAEVSYRKSAAEIVYDADITSPALIAEALKDAGFPAGGSGRGGLIADAVSAAAVLILAILIPKLTGLVAVPEAEYGAGLGALFMTGVLTGVHCIGMCGGIMLAGTTDAGGRVSAALTYNLGRMISYTAMGALCGALGTVISYDKAFKSMFFTLCGLLIILIGLRMWGVPFLRRLHAALIPPCPFAGVKKRGKAFMVGLLTGFMPCGALGAMWLYSASSGSALRGALSMLVFAAGTIPAMFAFGVLGVMIPKRYNKYLLKTSVVLIVALGLVLTVKGLSLL